MLSELSSEFGVYFVPSALVTRIVKACEVDITTPRSTTARNFLLCLKQCFPRLPSHPLRSAGIEFYPRLQEFVSAHYVSVL